MSFQDNSEWLERLLASEAKPHRYKNFYGILSKDSLFLRVFTTIATIVMIIAFLWALSTLDFIPGFSDEAKKFVSWGMLKYSQVIAIIHEAYEILSTTDWI